MNKNKILSGAGKNLIGGGKWGRRGREVGGKGEGSGGKGGGNWEWGTPCPPPLVSFGKHLSNSNLSDLSIVSTSDIFVYR